MSISEISTKLDAAVQSIEARKAKVKEANDKRAVVVAELDAVCNRVAKDFGDAVAEAHKLRDALHVELAKIPALGTTMPGVIKGIS